MTETQQTTNNAQALAELALNIERAEAALPNNLEPGDEEAEMISALITNAYQLAEALTEQISALDNIVDRRLTPSNNSTIAPVIDITAA